MADASGASGRAEPAPAGGLAPAEGRGAAASADPAYGGLGSRTCAGGGTLSWRGRIAVVHVRGSARERGLQHGRLLADRIRGGIVSYFVDLFRVRLRKAAEQSGKRIARLVPLAVKRFYLDNFLFPRLIAHMPRELREELAGLAEGAGIDARECAQTSVFADVFLYFLGKNFQAMGRLLPPSAAEACTSFAAWGPATADGSFLHARNLDFFGVGVWDRTPAVIYHEPDRGMPYVSISSAGVGPAGITGINQAGVTVAPQIKRTRDVHLDGMGMLYLASEIARRAESLEDAVKIARETTPAVGFSLVVTDARHEAAAAIECSGSGVRVRVRRAGDEPAAGADAGVPPSTFVQTNHYTTDLRDRELDIAASLRQHTEARWKRGADLLTEHWGRVTPQRLADFLADHHDPLAGRDRWIGNIILQPCNISAVVFRPLAGEFWVAEGEAPASHSRYLRFTLEDAQDAGEGQALPAPAWADGPGFAAYRTFVAAYAASMGDCDGDTLIRMLEEVAAADPAEPIYPYVAGLHQLKEGRAAEAERCFTRALEAGPDSTHRRGAIGIWRAVARSLQGGWQAARAEFRAAAEAPGVGADLRARARLWADRPPVADDLRAMTPDLQYGDGILSP